MQVKTEAAQRRNPNAERYLASLCFLKNGADSLQSDPHRHQYIPVLVLGIRVLRPHLAGGL
jgi:hypothetical protein